MNNDRSEKLSNCRPQHAISYTIFYHFKCFRIISKNDYDRHVRPSVQMEQIGSH